MNAPGPAPAVLVDDLVVRFGALTAVGGVSFAVAPREVFALLGPNGAGKTTTIRVLTTLLAPSAGRALYPLAAMPAWLHAVARVNPLTYEVQGLRQRLVGVGGAGEVWLDFAVVIGFFAIMLAAATRAYRKAIL